MGFLMLIRSLLTFVRSSEFVNPYASINLCSRPHATEFHFVNASHCHVMKEAWNFSDCLKFDIKFMNFLSAPSIHRSLFTVDLKEKRRLSATRLDFDPNGCKFPVGWDSTWFERDDWSNYSHLLVFNIHLKGNRLWKPPRGCDFQKMNWQKVKLKIAQRGKIYFLCLFEVNSA